MTGFLRGACICAAALVMGPALASAATITVGTASSFGANAGPFGLPENSPANSNPWGPEFQQLYSSSAFSGPVSISSIGFDYAQGSTSMQPATYTLTLSTTSNSIASATGSASYITGSNSEVVYSGAGVSDVGGVFTFNLAKDFTYNPASGNLLLTVTATPVGTAAAPLYLEGQQFSNPTMSEIYDTNVGVKAFNNGLVTNFGVGETPLPATGWLLMSGLGGLCWLRRRAKVA